jgi:hypothetical protein
LELCPKQLLVQSPQPTSNPNQTHNQKQPFLQRLLDDEVVGLASLLLLILKIKYDLLLKQKLQSPDWV